MSYTPNNPNGQTNSANSAPVTLSTEQELKIDLLSTKAKQDLLLAELQLKADLTETQPVSLLSVPSHPVTNTGTFATQATLSAETTKVIGTVNIAGTIPISGTLTDSQIRATPLPINGTVTSNIGTTNGLALDTSINTLLKPASTLAAVTNITNTVTIKADTLVNQTNALKIDGSATTQPISVTTLPLPTGAATAANQTTQITAEQAILAKIIAAPATEAKQTQPGVDIGDVTINNTTGVGAVNIQDGGNSITVDGSITANAGTNLNTSSLNLETTQTAMSSKLPATLGQKVTTASMAVVLASDQTSIPVAATLAAGTNNIGDVDVLTMPAITGTVTANAGTNLNTNALALETGGNLTAIKLDVDKIPSQGQALAASSMPVVLTAAQITTLTPPAAITGFNLEATQLLVKAKTDNLDVALSTRLKAADTLSGVTTVAAVTSITNALPTGSNLLGKVGIDQTTPGTTNKVNIGTDGQLSTNGTIFTFSTLNSSTAQLAASAIFAGVVETVTNQQSYSVLFFSDQNATITILQYIDAAGVKLIQTQTFNYLANGAFARSGVLNGNYAKVTVQNTGGSTTTTLQLDVAYGTIPASTQLNNTPISINELNGTVIDTNSGNKSGGTQRFVLATDQPNFTTALNVSLGSTIASTSELKKATYRASTIIPLVTAVTVNVPFFNIIGSATKTVIVKRITVSGMTLTAVGYFSINTEKLSTASSGGTSTTLVATTMDTNNAAVTAIVKAYTVAPTKGTLIGTLRSWRALWQSTTAAAGGVTDYYDFNFGDVNGSGGVVLRGVAQELALTFPVVLTSAGTLSVDIEWTEE